jgi:hypothetical protein
MVLALLTGEKTSAELCREQVGIGDFGFDLDGHVPHPV